jgi:hypothetical protein
MAASNGQQNPTSQASMELQKKLADMKAERLKIDSMWLTAAPVQAQGNAKESDSDPLLQTQKPAFFQKGSGATYATWG